MESARGHHSFMDNEYTIEFITWAYENGFTLVANNGDRLTAVEMEDLILQFEDDG